MAKYTDALIRLCTIENVTRSVEMDYETQHGVVDCSLFCNYVTSSAKTCFMVSDQGLRYLSLTNIYSEHFCRPLCIFDH